MLTEKVRVRKGYRDSPEITIEKTEVPGLVGILALEMVQKWGMVAGMPDGEDSSGRHKLRLSTPDELTDRAIITAELLQKKLQDGGHMLKLPVLLSAEDYAATMKFVGEQGLRAPEAKAINTSDSLFNTEE